jgi:hypothetical protein
MYDIVTKIEDLSEIVWLVLLVVAIGWCIWMWKYDKTDQDNDNGISYQG